MTDLTEAFKAKIFADPNDPKAKRWSLEDYLRRTYQATKRGNKLAEQVRAALPAQPPEPLA